MAKVTVKLDGLSKLGDRMRGLASDIAKKISGQSTAAGAQLMRKDIRKRAPVDTGNLRRNIIVKKLPRSQTKLTSEHIVTVRRGRTKSQIKKNAREARYALYLEFGTVKMAARPFLRPGFEATKGPATTAIVTKLHDRIEEANRGK